MHLTVVILTFNEELHIERALKSAQPIASRCFVIDSGSTDRTVEIAESCGATVLTNPFVSQAQQFNWALAQLPADTQWVFRLDADEIITEGLAKEIAAKLLDLSPQTAGICISRRMNFCGQPVKFGGLFPVRLVRLLRHGKGESEDRWMDEHIVVDGEIAEFSGEIIDDNLNSLGWWTEKHNRYAAREAVEMLNLEYGFLNRASGDERQHAGSAGTKRWLKEKVYSRLPAGVRAFVYFLYRYIIRLGFLDTKEGQMFHVLQGFWYRYLVDAKLKEAKAYMKRHGVDAETAAQDVLGVEVKPAIGKEGQCSPAP